MNPQPSRTGQSDTSPTPGCPAAGAGDSGSASGELVMASVL